MTNSILLKEKISDSGYKISFLAEKMSLTRQGLSNKVEGKNEFLVSEMTILSELLGLKNSEREDIFLK